MSDARMGGTPASVSRPPPARAADNTAGDNAASDTSRDDTAAYAPTLRIREVFTRFWPYTKPFRGRLLLGLALGLTLPLIQAATIWMFKILVDRVLVPKDLSVFWWIAGIYLAITAVAGAASFANSYLSRWLAQHFVLGLRTSVFAHLHSLSLDVLERRRLGDVLSRLTSDVNAVEQLVVSGVTRSLGNIVRIFLFTGLLFWLSWQLALVALAVTPLFALVAKSFSARIKTASRAARHHSGAMTSVAEESLSNAPLVHAYQRQDFEVARFDAEGRKRMDAKLAAARLGAGFGPLVDALELVGVLSVIGLGTWQMANGDLTLGALFAFIAYLAQLLSPVRSMARLTNTIYSASAGADRISELLTSRSSVPERTHAHTIGRAHGVVELDHVGFSYPGAAQPALHDISARVGPGEVLALAGPSGAGKTTITKLILRMYDATSGAVRIDGHDIRDLTVESLRANIAVVLQETLIFHGTIADNIAYGRRDATPAQVREAAQAADVEEFVCRLPDGYDTVVGERGRWLSGGQRQRIAIARALIRDAPILILDEPATGLDEATGERVFAPLRRLMAGRTTIVIAHDPQTIEHADHVLTLAKGRSADRVLV